MNISAKIAHNTIIQVAGKIIASILSLIALMLMTRYLGPAGFGEYTTAFTFVSIFAICADFGLTLVTSRLLSVPGADEKKIINNLFGLRIVLALGLVGLAPFFVFALPYSRTIQLAVLIGSIAFVFPLLNQVFVGYFQKNLNLFYVALAEVLNRVVFLIAVIISIRSNFGLIGMMTGLSIAALLSFLVHFYFINKKTRIQVAWDFAYWKEILKISWPLAITIIFNLIYLKADTFLLSLLKSQEEVGLYGAAYRIVEVLSSLPFIFAGLILPILSAAWFGSDRIRYKKVLQKSLDLTIIAIFPLIIGGQFLANGIISIVAGKEYAGAGVILQILLIAVGLIFTSCLFTHAVIAIDKQKKIIGAYIFTGISSLALYLLLIPRYSYYGAAIGTVYSELAITIAAIYIVYRYSDFRPNLKIVPKVIGSSLIMTAFLLIIPSHFRNSHLGTITLIVAAGIVYLLSLYLIRGINSSDLNAILNKKNNSELNV